MSDRYGALMVVIGSPRGGFMSYVDSVVGQSVARRMLGQRRVPLLVVPSGVDVDTVFPGQA